MFNSFEHNIEISWLGLEESSSNILIDKSAITPDGGQNTMAKILTIEIVSIKTD